MEYRLLGPVQVYAEGRLIEAGPPRQRSVLAALLVDAGQVVGWDTLVDRVWGEQAPVDARGSVRAHITRIRQVLQQAAGAAAPARLVHRSGGYVLEVDRERVDLHRFRQLVRRAQDADPDQERLVLLREAVALWRGAPLAGISGDWAIRMRESLAKERLDAVVAWANAELAAHNPAVTTGPLADLASQYPLVESLTAALMRAQHALGRPADALEEYTRLRIRLAEELGTDPGPELQSLYQTMLRGEQAPPRAAPAGSRPAAMPAQLPADVHGFAGRIDQLARLDTLLNQPERAPTAVVISAVSGTAGVGKTTLAVHWAHRVADRFPDGQLYINLRGFDLTGNVMDPAEAVRRFLDALGVEPQRIPADLDAQAALYRSELAGRRMLVVLDNARDTTQVRPLLPGTPTCLVLVTSRNQLTGLVAVDGAHPINLDLLSTAEAQELLARRIGADRVAAEPQAVEETIRACARLPLALAIVAAHAATRPRMSLAVLADGLRGSGDRLDALATDDPATDARAVFSWSYQALTPAAARLFRLLGLHPGPDVAAGAASLAALSVSRVRPLLAELTRASLLVEHRTGRYTCHDLLRAYATDLAHTFDPDEQRHAATHRILDHYLHTAYTAALVLAPARDPITLTPPQPGVTPEHPAGHQQALDWFTTEHPVLLAAVDHAAATGFDTHTWQLAWTLDDFLDRRGHWHDRAATGRAAVAAAERLADPTAQARAHRNLANAYTQLGHVDDAHTHLRHALHLYHQIGNPAEQAHTHRSLAHQWGRQGRYTVALDHAQQALDLFRAAGHQVGQSRALNSVGWYHALLGDHEQALTACQQALTLHQELGDHYGQANTWDSLGYAYHHLGHHTQAVTCYHHAIDLFRNLGERYGEAATLTHLGDTHHTTGNPTAARDAWQQALTILDDLDHPDAGQVRTKLAALNTPTHTDQPPGE